MKPRIEIRPANLRDASFVAANMREWDRKEISAVTPIDNTAQLAATLLMASGFADDDKRKRWAHIAYLDGQPVAVFGFARAAPHIVSGWAYGTNKLPRVIPQISRFALRFYPPLLLAAGIVRAEVRCMADHDLSLKWLQTLGCVLETPTSFEYGAEGQLFLMLAWTRRTWRARTVWGLAWAARLKR